MAAMAIRWQADETRYRSSSVFWQVGDEAWPALVVGRVSGLVYRYPKPGMDGRSGADAWQTRFTLQVDQARHRDRWIQCAGGLAVSIDEDIPEIRGGDRLRIAGRLDEFRMPSNPGVSDRSLADRNRHQHARLLVRSRTQVEMLDRPRWSLLAIADRLSRSGEQTLNACLGANTGALASALVVGRRYSLDVELQDQLLETGTVHMLSVSGLHLGILALSLRYLAIMLRLRRHWQWGFVAISCVVFAAVTGAQPPVIRAATLVGVMLLAYASNRVDSPLNSLSAAAFLLMIINPTNLFQVGVQLSFLAVATLFVAGQRSDPIRNELRVEEEVNRMLRSTYGPWRRRIGLAADRLRDALWFSLCVTLTTTPLVWLHFNIVSPIAVVANVLLSLPLTVGLISGLVAVCIGWISPCWRHPPYGYASDLSPSFNGVWGLRRMSPGGTSGCHRRRLFGWLDIIWPCRLA
jgi:competence protein ComEC